MKFRIIIISLIFLLLVGIVFLLTSRSSAPTPATFVPASFPVATTLQNSGSKKTFDQLITTPPRPPFKTVLDNMYLDVYAVLPCTESPSESVIMLTGKYSENKPINTFESAVASVVSWEPDIASDIGLLLFPTAKVVAPAASKNFERVSVLSPIVVTEYEKRTAVTVDGKPGEIYYAWTLNYVFFATSQSCLEGAMSAVYSGD